MQQLDESRNAVSMNIVADTTPEELKRTTEAYEQHSNLVLKSAGGKINKQNYNN